MRFLFSILAAFAVSVTVANACNSVNLNHLSQIKVDKISGQDYRGGHFELTETDQIQSIVAFFISLSPEWTQLITPPDTETIPIRFHSEEKIEEMITVSEWTMYRRACFRAMSPEEREKLDTLLSSPLAIRTL